MNTQTLKPSLTLATPEQHPYLLGRASAWLAAPLLWNVDESFELLRAVNLMNRAARAGRVVWDGSEVAIVERFPSYAVDVQTLAHVFEHARSGDSVAGSVVRDTARYIGMAIANIVTVVDPDVVVVGGVIADAADLLLEASRAEAAKRLGPAIAATLSVRVSTLGDDAAPLGAVRAALLAP